MTDREKIAETLKNLYKRGLITLSEGNVSVRKEEKILITPGGLRKDRVREQDIAVITLNGEILQGRPSSEYLLHLEIYRKRKDINSIVHAHPPFVLALSTAGIPLKFPILAEAVFLLGPVPILNFELPSSEKLAKSAGEKATYYDALILQNHGAVTLAENLDLALAMMETLEHVAEVLWRGLMLGRVNLIEEKRVEDLLKLRKNYGLSPRSWKAEDFLWSLEGVEI